MPLNNSYDEQAVVQAIASALATFYGTLIEKIDAHSILIVSASDIACILRRNSIKVTENNLSKSLTRY